LEEETSTEFGNNLQIFVKILEVEYGIGFKIAIELVKEIVHLTNQIGN